MPQGPSEVVAEFTVEPAPDDDGAGAVEAAVEAARATGLALEVGPEATGLAGGRAEVLDALERVLDAAIRAGARAISVKVRAATEAR